FDLTPTGFHAQVLQPAGRVFVDPFQRGDTVNHIVYYTRDFVKPGPPFRCDLSSLEGEGSTPAVAPAPDRTPGVGPVSIGPLAPIGGTLRTYRRALSADCEYTGLGCAP